MKLDRNAISYVIFIYSPLGNWTQVQKGTPDLSPEPKAIYTHLTPLKFFI